MLAGPSRSSRRGVSRGSRASSMCPRPGAGSGGVGAGGAPGGPAPARGGGVPWSAALGGQEGPAGPSGGPGGALGLPAGRGAATCCRRAGERSRRPSGFGGGEPSGPVPGRGGGVPWSAALGGREGPAEPSGAPGGALGLPAGRGPVTCCRRPGERSRRPSAFGGGVVLWLRLPVGAVRLRRSRRARRVGGVWPRAMARGNQSLARSRRTGPSSAACWRRSGAGGSASGRSGASRSAGGTGVRVRVAVQEFARQQRRMQRSMQP